MTKRGSQDNVVTYEHYCDTKNDLTAIPKDQITLGSTAVVLKDDGDAMGVYMANSSKEWIPFSSVGNAGGGGSGGGSGSGSIVTLDVKSFPNADEPPSDYYIPYNYEQSRVMTKAEIDDILMRCIENNAVLRMIERVTVEDETRISCITPTNYYISNDYSAIFYMNNGFSGSGYNNDTINYITIEYDNVNGMLVGQYSANASYGNPVIVYDN